MKITRLLSALLFAALIISLCAFGTAAENTESLYLLDVTGESRLSEAEYAQANSGDKPIIVRKGGRLTIDIKGESPFGALLVEEGGTVVVAEDASIEFYGNSVISGSITANGANSALTLSGIAVTINKQAKIDISGQLRFGAGSIYHHGAITVKSGGRLDTAGCSVFAYEGSVITAEDGGVLGDEGVTYGYTGSKPVLDGGEITGYIIVGVSAFVLGAALMLAFLVAKRKKPAEKA